MLAQVRASSSSLALCRQHVLVARKAVVAAGGGATSLNGLSSIPFTPSSSYSSSSSSTSSSSSVSSSLSSSPSASPSSSSSSSTPRLPCLSFNPPSHPLRRACLLGHTTSTRSFAAAAASSNGDLDDEDPAGVVDDVLGVAGDDIDGMDRAARASHKKKAKDKAARAARLAKSPKDAKLKGKSKGKGARMAADDDDEADPLKLMDDDDSVPLPVLLGVDDVDLGDADAELDAEIAAVLGDDEPLDLSDDEFLDDLPTDPIEFAEYQDKHDLVSLKGSPRFPELSMDESLRLADNIEAYDAPWQGFNGANPSSREAILERSHDLLGAYDYDNRQVLTVEDPDDFAQDDEGGRALGYCPFCKFGTGKLRAENTKLLSFFVNERGIIMPKRLTSVCSKHQRKVARVVKRSRAMNMLPYTRKLHPSVRFTSLKPNPVEAAVAGQSSQKGEEGEAKFMEEALHELRSIAPQQ